jgi:hypothetical protein
MSQLKQIFQQKSFKAGIVIFLAAILTAGLILLGLSIFQDDEADQAQAAPVALSGVSKCGGVQIQIEYGNPGDRALPNALLELEISEFLTPVKSSFTDDLFKDSPATINPDLIVENADGSHTLTYGPGSADDPTPGGDANARDAEPGTGFITFIARVKPSAGSFINDAAVATLTHADPDLEEPSGSVVILLTGDNQCITAANVDAGVCTPSTLAAGDVTECVYDLVDNDGNPFPAGGNQPSDVNGNNYGLGEIPTSSIDTATGDSDQCYLEDRSGWKLVCENVPTDDATGGSQGGDVDFPDGTVADNKASVTISGDAPVDPDPTDPGDPTTPPDPTNPPVVDPVTPTDNPDPATSTSCNRAYDENSDGCIVYFVGLDGATPSWDPVTQYNLNWPLTQKFKDGSVDAYFDNIFKSDDTQIADGSSCTFDFYRNSEDQVLRSYTSTTSNGVCEVNFPETDQTVNYYRVKVTATDSVTSEKVFGYGNLVLAVGGDRTRDDVTIDLGL